MTDTQINLINQAEALVGRDMDHYDNEGVHFVSGKFYTYDQLESLMNIYEGMDLD